MHNNRLWLLFARQLSGEASHAESAELQSILQEYPDKQYLLDLLHDYFKLHPGGTEDDQVDDIYFEERFRKIITSDDEGQLPDFESGFPTKAIKRLRFKRLL